jgi:hypothetical protein
MSNTFQPLQASEWTAGRWQIGNHELTAGDVIDFTTGAKPQRGRVEHDGRGYVVIPDDGTPAVSLANVRDAQYIRSGRL